MKDDNHNQLYSQFDANGMPTHDANGAPISKKKIKESTKIV